MKLSKQIKPTRLHILPSLNYTQHLLGKPKSLKPDAPTALVQRASDQEKKSPLLWNFIKKLTRGTTQQTPESSRPDRSSTQPKEQQKTMKMSRLIWRVGAFRRKKVSTLLLQVPIRDTGHCRWAAF